MPHPLSVDAQAIRRLIESFITERRDAKLEKLSSDDAKYQQTLDQFERDAWLSDAARRVGQLQMVTHVLKGIHPDAKGTNLFVHSDNLPNPEAVGSHSKKSVTHHDITGNAAALDVYKLLRISYKNRSLLERFCCRCPDAIAALSDTPSQAAEWAAAFAAISDAKGPPSSHVYAKQLYWLKGEDAARDSDYVLLAPLFPSTLVHDAFQEIQRDRFSDEAKEARRARRENRPADAEVHSYPELAFRKLGGTKPQNISQLNSERGGQNILLSSLPPRWDSSKLSPILNVPSALPTLRGHINFCRPLYNLRAFLLRNPTANKPTRIRVHRLIERAVEGVISFTMKAHRLPAGWTALNTILEDGTAHRCELPLHEKQWLDPFRAAHDDAFRQQRMQSSWQDTLRHSIACEINRVLNQGEKPLRVGDTEIREWERRAGQHSVVQSLIKIDADYMTALDKELSEAIELIDDEEEDL